MKKTINVTAVASVTFLLIAIAVWFTIPYGIDEYGGAVDIGPRAFPRIVSGGMLVLSLLQLALIAFGVQKGKYVEFCILEQTRVFVAMVLALTTVLFSLFVNLLVAGVICSVIFLVLFRMKNWRYYLAVAATGIILYLLLKYVMHIQF